MFCRFCGATIEDESLFCNKCGRSLTEESNTDHVNQSEKTKTISTYKPHRKTIIISGSIVAFICLIIFLFFHMTGIKVIKEYVDAGSVVNTNDIIKTNSKNAYLTIENDIDTSKLGKLPVFCTVNNGILKRSQTVYITVIDALKPEVNGPDSISVISGKNFEIIDYYEIRDFDKNLTISLNPTVDTAVEGKSDVVLSVMDSSGNETQKNITINVIKLNTNEEMALKAINKYIADGNDESNIKGSIWVMKTASTATNGVDYYVEVVDNVLYAIYDNGDVSEFTEIDCGGEFMHEAMVFAVHYDGSTVSTSKLLN